MYDVGKIRLAALAIYNYKPGAVSVLVLIGMAESVMRGLQERRDALGALTAYEGAQQWDKDFARYAFYLEESKITAEQIAKPGAPSTIWADKYSKLLLSFFKGGVRAGASYWATLANQLDALEGAERDLYEQTSWLLLWWAGPAAELAATLGEAYNVQETQEDFGKWTEKVEEKVDTMVAKGAGALGIVAVAAAVWFGWPVLAGLFLASGRD